MLLSMFSVLFDPTIRQTVIYSGYRVYADFNDSMMFDHVFPWNRGRQAGVV